MVRTPPHMKYKLEKIKMELALLAMKEKYLRCLSEKDIKRKKELMRKLCVKY